MRRWPGRLSARGLVAGLVSLAATTAFLATAGAAQATGASAPVGEAGAVPSGSAQIGALPSSTTMAVDVALAPRDPAALSLYATQVATPGSPLYHAYIAKGQFASMFGPTSATISNVYAALRALGLHPGAISSDHLSIPVTATAGQFESALGVKMASYRLAHGGTGFANTTAPRLPATIAPAIQAIIGLDNLTKMHSFAERPSPASLKLTRKHPVRPAGEPTGGPQPCTAASDQQANGGLTADELAFSYEFSPLYHAGDFGKGQTVGIVEFGEPNSTADINTFQHCYGTHTKISYQKVDGFNGHGAGAGEAALDIETVLSTAPGANIIVYQAPNTGKAAFDIYRVMVDADRARVISESYGLCDRLQRRAPEVAVTTLYEQAAVQGQTIVASSGDAGSEACLPNGSPPSQLSANFPASDPLVLGVGGTILFNVTPRPGEAVWNERSLSEGAGGGGKAQFWAEPGFQKAFGIKASVREVPDVSANADPQTGYVVFWHGSWTQIGGTSGAAPLWAGFLALTNNRCASSPVGWVNPTMYFVASNAVKAVVIDDINTVNGSLNNNDYTGQGGGHYAVGSGYDMATGLGSPIGGALASNLCKFSAAPHGYWLVASDGHVYAFHAPFHGSDKNSGARVVGIAASHGNGYWIVNAKGKVKGFGVAAHGSVGHPNGSIVGIAADKSGNGYWVVSSTGHVYAFGGAKNHGGGTGHGRVVGIALDPTTGGYWIATASGRVIADDAKGFANKSFKNVTGIAYDPKKQGYWLVQSNGSVHAFGVPNFGGMPFGKVGTTVGIAGDPVFGGYFLATQHGHVAAINAVWHGDQPGVSSITAIASSH